MMLILFTGNEEKPTNNSSFSYFTVIKQILWVDD